MMQLKKSKYLNIDDVNFNGMLILLIKANAIIFPVNSMICPLYPYKFNVKHEPFGTGLKTFDFLHQEYLQIEQMI